MSEDNEGLWTLEKGCEYLGVGYAFGWREAQAGRMPGAFMLGGTEDPDTGRIKRGKWMIVPEVMKSWVKEKAELSLQGARLKMVNQELMKDWFSSKVAMATQIMEHDILHHQKDTGQIKCDRCGQYSSEYSVVDNDDIETLHLGGDTLLCFDCFNPETAIRVDNGMTVAEYKELKGEVEDVYIDDGKPF